MDIHLPRPAHGWHEFADEIAIISIGVMIGLGGEQLVEAIRDHQTARETLDTLRDELQDGLGSLQLRKMAEPCVDRRLGEVRALLYAWHRTGRFATPRWVSQAPMIWVSLARYDAAVSAGRISLLSNERQYRIGSTARALKQFERVQESEMMAWSKLRLLEAGPDALSSSDRTMILGSLQEASALNYSAKRLIRQTLASTANYGLHPDLSRFRPEASNIWRSGRYAPSICISIKTPSDRANKNQVVPLPQ